MARLVTAILESIYLVFAIHRGKEVPLDLLLNYCSYRQFDQEQTHQRKLAWVIILSISEPKQTGLSIDPGSLKSA